MIKKLMSYIGEYKRDTLLSPISVTFEVILEVLLPMLMEEFQNVLLSYRLRGNPPAHETFGGKVKYLIYQVKIIMQSFYPLMLNTAKRSRTTVEALELRGYRYAAVNKSVKKIKLAALKVTYNDGLFLAISFLVVAVAVLISTLL